MYQLWLLTFPIFQPAGISVVEQKKKCNFQITTLLFCNSDSQECVGSLQGMVGGNERGLIRHLCK